MMWWKFDWDVFARAMDLHLALAGDFHTLNFGQPLVVEFIDQLIIMEALEVLDRMGETFQLCIFKMVVVRTCMKAAEQRLGLSSHTTSFPIDGHNCTV
jgi:hypothetical protein